MSSSSSHRPPPSMPESPVNNQYHVNEELAKGASGLVVEVRDAQAEEKPDIFAMKIVDGTDPGSFQLFQIEKEILLDLNQKQDRNHFPTLHDWGSYISKGKTYYFMVMTRLGKSLEQLVEQEKFAPDLAMRVGVQCLVAIEDLHNSGWFHRDIKPGNFAVDWDEQKDIIYLLDFDLGKKIVDGQVQPVAPEEKFPFCGSALYASIGVHQGDAPCPRDDLESWFYLLMKLTKGKLPWEDGMGFAASTFLRQTLEMKRSLRNGQSEHWLGGCPTSYPAILKYIISMDSHPTKPDYDSIKRLLVRQIHSDCRNTNWFTQLRNLFKKSSLHH